MPEHRAPQPLPDELSQAPGGQPCGEEVDALPVLVQEASAVRLQRPALGVSRGRVAAAAGLPAVQAAAVAAGSFVAGAAVAGLVHRRRRVALPARKRAAGALARGGQRKPAPGQLQIVGSRSLLVDVHLLGVPIPER